jgi:hypothetical protein
MTVNYNLHAVVTTSDLEFDIKEIDFGFCTIYETARVTVNLTNKSMLCQPFGFVKLPEVRNFFHLFYFRLFILKILNMKLKVCKCSAE